jgi:hypothetical protein
MPSQARRQAKADTNQTVLERLLDQKRTDAIWNVWPRRDVDALTRLYYLAQGSFRLFQIVVINFERRRKDYRQMLTHHIITLLLVTSSYAYHFIPVGTLILCIMDFVDILLPVGLIVHGQAYQDANLNAGCQDLPLYALESML